MSELTREQVERECQWLVEEHCQSAARKWDAHDAFQRQRIEQLEALVKEVEGQLTFLGATIDERGSLKLNMKKYHAGYRCDQHQKEPWQDIDSEIDCFVCLKQKSEARIVTLEADLDAVAWKTSPAAAQAQIEQQAEKIDAQATRIGELEATVSTLTRRDAEQQKREDNWRYCFQEFKDLANGKERKYEQIHALALKGKIEQLEAQVKEREHHYNQLKEAYDAKVSGIPIGPIVGAQTITNQQLHIQKLEAQWKGLEEWKRIVEGTGTDQEAVIRMAATEYAKIAIQCWKDKVVALEAEVARLKGVQ